MIKVATVFSGIGAAEQALQQMNVEHRIVFACDNGERYLKQTPEEIEAILKNFSAEYRETVLASPPSCASPPAAVSPEHSWPLSV